MKWNYIVVYEKHLNVQAGAPDFGGLSSSDTQALDIAWGTSTLSVGGLS